MQKSCGFSNKILHNSPLILFLGRSVGGMFVLGDVSKDNCGSCCVSVVGVLPHEASSIGLCVWQQLLHEGRAKLPQHDDGEWVLTLGEHVVYIMENRQRAERDWKGIIDPY